MKTWIIILFGILVTQSLRAQEHKETIKKTLPLPTGDNVVLVVENIFGNVEVEGYSGDEVIFEIQSEISADNQEKLEDALKKVFVSFDIRKDTVDVFLDGTCGCRRDKYHRFNWEENCDFKFRFDFNVKVPQRANLHVSTVIDGKVEIKNIAGNVTARNVNGDINVEKITGPADVHVINGDVNVRYDKSPHKNSKYYSLNGTVNVYYPSDLSADMSFKTFQGEMYTNFDISEWLPPLISSTKSKDKNITRYKIEKKSQFRVGKGGVSIDFETFNGDVYVRKI